MEQMTWFSRIFKNKEFRYVWELDTDDPKKIEAFAKALKDKVDIIVPKGMVTVKIIGRKNEERKAL